MRLTRGAIAVLVAGFVSWSLAATQADAQVCLPTFGYGNVGYAAGYSFAQAGWCGPRWRGWCGPRWGGWCAPRWGGWCGPGWGCRPWGWRRWCAPPVYGYGWPVSYGTTWFPSCGSVWMGAPFGGSFFSGSFVPYPTISWPLIAPGFVSANTVVPSAVATLAAARPAAADPQAPQGVAVIHDLRARRAASLAANLPRPSNAVSRLRAARLVAVGDRHLREAGGDPGRLRDAVEAYRRAAAIAADQPDTFVRQALALVALGERAQADAALAKAAALDGRLADVSRPPAAGPVDPTFGDRPAGSPQPVVARGQAILRQIAAQAGPAADADDAPAVARIAARWAERFGAAAALVARR